MERTDPYPWHEEGDGPGPEYYRELAEERGTPWPVGAFITRANHLAGIGRARQCVPVRWPCPVCGGPEFCADLAATLPFRQCGYAPVADPDGLWIHQ